jgi:hypothetical protein
MFLKSSGHGGPLSGYATPHIEPVCFSQLMMSKHTIFQVHSCKMGFDIQVIAHYKYQSPPAFVVHAYSKGKIAPGTGPRGVLTRWKGDIRRQSEGLSKG